MRRGGRVATVLAAMTGAAATAGLAASALGGGSQPSTPQHLVHGRGLNVDNIERDVDCGFATRTPR